MFVCLAGMSNSTSLGSQRGRHSKHHPCDVAVVVEFRRAASGLDPPLHASDRPWNARCVRFDQSAFRDARVAAASFQLSLPVVAFERRALAGSRNGRAAAQPGACSRPLNSAATALDGRKRDRFRRAPAMSYGSDSDRRPPLLMLFRSTMFLPSTREEDEMNATATVVRRGGRGTRESSSARRHP